MMKRNIYAAGMAILTLATSNATAQTLAVDPALPVYARTTGVSGNLNSIGSDTLNNLMTLWAEGFRKQYPNVRIQIEGKGSSTAPPALIEGTAQLGPMSREMKAEEESKIEQKYGYKPSKVAVALDSLAVYVHKDSPLESLTMQQVDAIFSKTRSCGTAADISTWGALGLTGGLAKSPISTYGRNSASGTYGYFKEVALCKGDFKDTVKEQPGSASVVNGIAGDKLAIGYSGVGYKTSGVKTVALAKREGEPAYEATYENVLSGKYPLGRALYVYYVRHPSQPMDTLTAEFLKFVLSKEGQEVVVKDGYLPLPAKMAEKETVKLQ